MREPLKGILDRLPRPPTLGGLAQTVEANLRFHREMAELTLQFLTSASRIGVEFVQDVVSTLRTSATETRPPASAPQRPPKSPASSALVLEGVSGDLACSAFLVENVLGKELSSRLELGALQGPAGSRLDAKASFEPERVVLAAGDEVMVRVFVPITDDLLAGEAYRGEIRTVDMPGTSVAVVVRRTVATAAAAEPEPAAKPGTAAKPGAAAEPEPAAKPKAKSKAKRGPEPEPESETKPPAGPAAPASGPEAQGTDDT